MADRITVSINPTIPLGPYQNLKPFASVSFDSTDDEEADMARASVILRRIALRALVLELGMVDELVGALANGPEALAEYAKKELSDVTSRTEKTETAPSASPKTSAGPAVKPGPKRLARG